ncbi:MAG: hypothetical protein ACI4ON_00470 [Clostridia bacterium]
MSNNYLVKDIQRIVVEREDTKEILAVITNDDIEPANNIQVRIKPVYKREIDKFNQIAKPISEFLRKNYNMHATAIITDSNAKIVIDDIGTPTIKD